MNDRRVNEMLHTDIVNAVMNSIEGHVPTERCMNPRNKPHTGSYVPDSRYPYSTSTQSRYGAPQDVFSTSSPWDSRYGGQMDTDGMIINGLTKQGRLGVRHVLDKAQHAAKMIHRGGKNASAAMSKASDAVNRGRQNASNSVWNAATGVWEWAHVTEHPGEEHLWPKPDSGNNTRQNYRRYATPDVTSKYSPYQSKYYPRM